MFPFSATYKGKGNSLFPSFLQQLLSMLENCSRILCFRLNNFRSLSATFSGPLFIFTFFWTLLLVTSHFKSGSQGWMQPLVSVGDSHKQDLCRLVPVGRIQHGGCLSSAIRHSVVGDPWRPQPLLVSVGDSSTATSCP